ncbi:MAG TPA: PQQ-dependent sugar dehydrogenase [Chryseosolibacter sp.]
MNITKLVITSLLVVIAFTSAQAQTKQAIAEGQRLFATHCANCHGNAAQGAVKAGFDISIITERGGKQPSDLTDATWDHGSTDAEIFKVIKEGMPSVMMPPFQGSLTDNQIRSVIGYVRSLATPNTKKTSVASKGSSAPKQAGQLTLELADYLEMPITGDMSGDRVTGVMARGSIMIDEPGARQRFFLNDLTGPLYILDKKTKQLTTYLNFATLFPQFMAARGYAAGLMNFVFDPEYVKNGIFYTLHMEKANAPIDSLKPIAGGVAGLDLSAYKTTSALAKSPDADARFAREVVIVEWIDRDIANTTFEGTAREVFRLQVPVLFHPLNEMTFNPTARPGDADWRVMYLGVGDASTGERPGPNRMFAQRLDTYQGKILRIIPTINEHASTSTVSENGQYRIPNDNPFVSVDGARKEIWAYGIRNPHRLTWYIDPAKPREPTLLAFDIGLVSWETVIIVKKAANYGYPLREGVQSMGEGNTMGALPQEDLIPILISDSVKMGTVKPTYPVLAYPHAANGGDAIANGFFYKGKRHKALQGTFVFGDITTGHLWYANMREVLAADDGNATTLAKHYELLTQLRPIVEETYRRRGGRSEGLPGRSAVAGAGRLDIRLAEDSAGEIYIISKGDGMIREIKSVK